MAEVMNKKLDGSTLIEVLIAMVIIMVVFSIAINLFNNVLSSGVSFKKIQIQEKLNILSKEVSEKGYVEDEHIKTDSVDYQFLTDTSGVAGISRLEIKASMNGKVLGTVRCLFKIKSGHEEN